MPEFDGHIPATGGTGGGGVRLRILHVIFRKELVESLRDRRTLFMMVGLPILLYPLLIFGMSRLQESQQEAQQQRDRKSVV